MTRRLASVAVALLVSACGLPLLGSAPDYGFIVITAGGTPLVGGSTDVPPTFDLRLHAAAAFDVQNVDAMLDGRQLTLLPAGGDVTATTPPMPLGSAHHLDVTIQGRAQGISIDFHVISPTQAMLAAHIDPNDGLVVDAVFDDPPDRTAMLDDLPAARVQWSDGYHARITWPGSPPASITLPATLATARGSHLAATATLDLTGLSAGGLRRVTVPAAPPLPGTNVFGFVVNTSASNTSMARHQSVFNAICATGWTAQADGGVLGTPDPSAVRRAENARLPVWPSLANDTTDPAATTALLNDPAAVSRLVGIVARSVAFGGFAGVNLDFESMPGSDRDLFTAFVKALASAVHGRGAQLMVDVVPHDTSGINGFSAAYDVPALGSAADLIDLMAYDQHGDGGSPGPVAGLDWDMSVLAATLPGLNPSHTLLGVPLYARRWNSGGGAAASYSEAVAEALAVPGARVGYDFDAQTPVIVSGGNGLVTYFDDADSLARKIALVHANGLAGIALWRLGFEDPGFWSLFG